MAHLKVEEDQQISYKTHLYMTNGSFSAPSKPWIAPIRVRKAFHSKRTRLVICSRKINGLYTLHLVDEPVANIIKWTFQNWCKPVNQRVGSTTYA